MCHAASREQDVASVSGAGRLVHVPGLRVTHSPWCTFPGLKHTMLTVRDLVPLAGWAETHGVVSPRLLTR